MYKCSECSKTYKIKPDYCDCGNDVFEEMQLSLKPARQTPKVSATKTSLPQNTRLKRLIDSLDAVSVTIFVTCIILSFVIIVFVNPKTSDTEPKEHKTVKQTSANIPDISKIWNNAVPIVQTTVQPKTVSAPGEKTAPSVVKNTDTSSIQKTDVSVKKTSSSDTIKPAQSAKVFKKTQPKPVKTAQTVKKTQSKPAQTVQKTQPKPAQSVKKTQTQAPQKVQTKQNDTEWYNYRVALRQALFHNLSVTSVQGSGKCGIEFSIDKNGKFLNRAFSYQSDNESVNQAVYKMLMKMPNYYPPPESYNGQKVKMVFLFNNGSYYINYVD